MLDEKRIRRAIKKGYATAREAIADARECGSEFAKRVALETVREIRKTNADRRRALRLGHTV